MFRFDYIRVTSVEDVSKNLLQYGEKARLIAGGTDLMVQIREKDKRWKDVDYVIDLTCLKEELAYVTEDEEWLHIGALCTHTELEQNKLISQYLPFLGAACSTVGSPQIRNMGTIGGSICNASPAADPLTPLVASDALTVIHGPETTREVPITELYSEKGNLLLMPGEFVKEFKVKKISADTKTAFAKLGRRKALAISRLNVSTALTFDENKRITKARICPGCIFRNPSRVTEAEEMLIGQFPSEELFAEAGQMVSKVMIDKTGYRWSTEYKKPAVEGMVEKALLMAAGMEG